MSIVIIEISLYLPFKVTNQYFENRQLNTWAGRSVGSERNRFEYVKEGSVF